MFALVLLLAACSVAIPPSEPPAASSPPAPSVTSETTRSPTPIGGPGTSPSAAATPEVTRAPGDPIEALQRYGAEQAATFAGLWLDPPTQRVHIAFTGDVEPHRAVISRLVSIPVTLEPRPWPLAQLRALQERITADHAWLRTVGVALKSVGVDEKAGLVSVEVSSADPLAPAKLAARYGEQIRVTSDGTGVLLLPRGRLRGAAVFADGRPVANAVVDYRPLFDAGPMTALGYGTGMDGRFDLGFRPPGPWRITILGVVRDVQVPPGQDVDLRIVVP
jgi:hypothetical protein